MEKKYEFDKKLVSSDAFDKRKADRNRYMMKLYPNADGVAASGSTSHFRALLRVTLYRLSSYSVHRSFTSFRMTNGDSEHFILTCHSERSEESISINGG